MPRAIGQFTITDLNDINISHTPPSNPAINQLWLDNSVVPNQLKRWDGSKWVIINDPKDIIDEVDAVKSRVTKTETDIVQTKKDIALRVTQATFDGLGRTVSSQGTQIGLNTTAIALRATKEDLKSYEGAIIKQPTAPPHDQIGKLWLDTSKVPNVLYRSTGENVRTWIKASPTEAAEVGAFTASSGAALTTRVQQAESKITPSAIVTTVKNSTETNGDPTFTTYSTFKQFIDNITVEFNEMSIGAHNLVLRSDRLFSNVDYMTGEYEISETLEEGEQYTISVWGYLGSGKIEYRFYVSSTYITGLTYVGAGRYQATFTAPANATTSDIIRMYAYPSSITGQVSRIRQIKLEKGNVGTSYSRSPLEIYTGIIKLDKDGINVSRSATDINTQINNDGLSIFDGSSLMATFGATGAQIPNLQASNITGNIYNVLSENIILEVGGSSGFASITEAFRSINGPGQTIKLLGNYTITINVTGAIQDNLILVGYVGGNIIINFNYKAKLKGRIYLASNSTNLRITSATTNRTNYGVVSYDGSSTDLITGANSSNIIIEKLNFDRNGNTNVTSVWMTYGANAIVRDCDFGLTRYGIRSGDGAKVFATNNIGNPTSVSYYPIDSIIYARGTKPMTGINALYGFYQTTGTIVDAGSEFVSPPTTVTTLTQKFYATDLYTTLNSSGSRASSYGKTAAQGAWDTSKELMVGWIGFNRDAYDFMQGGRNTTVKLVVRRTANSHGQSAGVRPTPSGFSGSFGLATLGQWSSATISSSYVNTSPMFKFYNSNYGSGYAIFDNAYLEITTTKDL